MYFYTTAQQEHDLQNVYEQAVLVKQSELDKTHTNYIKFTARAHVYQPERIFYVQNGSHYYKHVSADTLCPTQKVPGGKTYTFDTFFAKQVALFCEKHASYKVVFKPSGSQGPCMNYNGSPGCIPAYLESETGEICNADNDDSYDIGCA